MKTIEIDNLPQIAFAHEYSAEQYKNSFKPRPQHIEVTYIAEGELYSVGQSGEITAAAGDVICMLFDGTTEVRSDIPHTHRTVCIKVSWHRAPSGITVPNHIKSADSEQIHRVIDKIIAAQNSYKGSVSHEAGLALELLLAVDRAAGAHTRSGGYIYVKRAKQYVALNIRKPIAQREVAEHLGISSGYLCAVFKKTQSETLMQYINKTKLTAIHSIMQKEHIPLYIAAEMYGYTDPNYVSRLYKKLFLKNITE